VEYSGGLSPSLSESSASKLAYDMGGKAEMEGRWEVQGCVGVGGSGGGFRRRFVG